jgi:AcrR family transcriptional regulator
MARPKIHDERLRARLLARASEIVSNEGFDGLGLRALAADCGTSTTAVYSLFGGKNGLLTALFDAAFRRLAEQLAAVRPGDDPIDDVVRTGLAYRDGALADPHLFTLMFAGRTVLPAAAQARTVTGTALGPLRAAVDRAVEEHLLRPDTDSATASLTLWTTVHGWATLELRGFLPPGAADMLEKVLRGVLDGWRIAPQGSGRTRVQRAARPGAC